MEKLPNDLIKVNIKEPSDFHLVYFKRNEIRWKKGKIRKWYININNISLLFKEFSLSKELPDISKWDLCNVNEIQDYLKNSQH